MIFLYSSKEYAGATAIEIVREMARDVNETTAYDGTIRDFLCRSLARLGDRIHMRELGASSHLSDETLAFNYLCLLDEYDIGRLLISPADSEA